MASLAEITGDGTKRQLSSDMSSSTGVQITNTPNVGKVYDMTNDVDKLVSSAGTFAKTMYAFSDDAMKTVASDHLVQYQLHKADILSNPNLSYEQQQESITNKVLELNNSVKEQLGDDRNRTIYDDTFYNKAKIDYSNTGIELSKLALTRDLGIEKDGFDQLLSIAPETDKNILKDALSNNIKNNKFSVYEVETAIVNAKVKNVKDKYLTDRTTLFNNDGSINSKNVTNILGDYLTIDQNGKMIPKEGITANEALAINDLASDISLKEDVYKAKVLKDTWNKNEDIFTKQFVNLTGSNDIKSYSVLAGNVMYAMNNNQLDPTKAKTIMTSIEAQVKEIQKGNEPKKATWGQISSQIIPTKGDSPMVYNKKLSNLVALSQNPNAVNQLISDHPEQQDTIRSAIDGANQFMEDKNNNTLGQSNNPISKEFMDKVTQENDSLLGRELSKAKPDQKVINTLLNNYITWGTESKYVTSSLDALTNSGKNFATLSEVSVALKLASNTNALSYEKDKTIFTQTDMIGQLNGILSNTKMTNQQKLDAINSQKNGYINLATKISQNTQMDIKENIQTGAGLWRILNANIDPTVINTYLVEGMQNGSITPTSTKEEMAGYIDSKTTTFDYTDQKGIGKDILGGSLFNIGKKLSRFVGLVTTDNLVIPQEVTGVIRLPNGTVVRKTYNTPSIKKAISNSLYAKKLDISDVTISVINNKNDGSKTMIMKRKDNGKVLDVFNGATIYNYLKLK